MLHEKSESWKIKIGVILRMKFQNSSKISQDFWAWNIRIVLKYWELLLPISCITCQTNAWAFVRTRQSDKCQWSSSCLPCCSLPRSVRTRTLINIETRRSSMLHNIGEGWMGWRLFFSSVTVLRLFSQNFCFFFWLMHKFIVFQEEKVCCCFSDSFWEM